MLLHLPIVIMASLSPIAVSESVPRFDIARECRFEGDSSKAVDRCSHDEAEAYQKLQTEWPQFGGASRSACLTEATTAGYASYVDLLICLEMARDVAKETASDDAIAKTTPPPQRETDVVDKHE